MELLIIAARTIFLYFLIMFIFRLMGKREIGELSILDLVVFIMIAEMAVIAIENPEDALSHTIVPMAVLMLVQIGLAYWSLKNQKVREILDGKPSVIIEHGKINEQEMKKQRYNFNDLLLQLREKNVKNITDVEFAILEPSGKLSVFEKEENNSGEKKKENLNLPFIMDGTIQEEHLLRANKTNLWLRQELRKLGYKEIKDISYCSYNNGVFYIDLKDQ
ncbi:DUF421 domain-containing protein [Bacillus songklensis]|uniref:DUF421 domain-containing protein n=1 Tax=Bacillus songklensis TaxID=1069116 RepID=A0ABV8B005_9BACI